MIIKAKVTNMLRLPQTLFSRRDSVQIMGRSSHYVHIDFVRNEQRKHIRVEHVETFDGVNRNRHTLQDFLTNEAKIISAGHKTVEKPKAETPTPVVVKVNPAPIPTPTPVPTPAPATPVANT